jgi:hypothetical protein
MRPNVGFSNRPFGVKRFQTIHHLSVNVARGHVLLFAIGTKALPSWDSKMRWNNLLAPRQSDGGPSRPANSPHPLSRRDIFPPFGGARVFSRRPWRDRSAPPRARDQGSSSMASVDDRRTLTLPVLRLDLLLLLDNWPRFLRLGGPLDRQVESLGFSFRVGNLLCEL